MSKTRLKELRMNKGLSQSQLATEMNLGKTTVSHYENDERNISTDLIVAFAEFFGVTTDYFLMTSNNPEATPIADENTRMFFDALTEMGLSELTLSEIMEIEDLVRTNVAQIKKRHRANADSHYGSTVKVAEPRTKIPRDLKD